MSTTRSPLAIVVATAAVAVTMLVVDLTWLAVVAQSLYDSMLAPLKSPEVFWPAAALFYAMYIAAIVVYGVLGATSPASAFRRGAGLGLVSYATYELTNWAVLRDWPALLVPIDIGWGVVLTALTSLVGKLVYTSVSGRKG